MADATPVRMTGDHERSVADIPDVELLRRAVLSARPYGRRRLSQQPKWVAVMDCFALGSTYATQLCRRFGIDPDEKVGQ